MSIWEEMFKYNLLNKKMYDNENGNECSVSVMCTPEALDTSYKKVAKFTPIMNGTVSMRIGIKPNWSGSTIRRDTTHYQIVNENEEVLFGRASDDDVLLYDTLELKAGETYYLQSKRSITSGNSTFYDVYYMPSSLSFSYSIKEDINCILAEAVSE